jgi:hypothetical protein
MTGCTNLKKILRFAQDDDEPLEKKKGGAACQMICLFHD